MWRWTKSRQLARARERLPEGAILLLVFLGFFYGKSRSSAASSSPTKLVCGMPRRCARFASSARESLLQQSLPADLVHRIVLFLSAYDALSASRVCRCLRDAALCEDVWSALTKQLGLEHVSMRSEPAGPALESARSEPALAYVRHHLRLRKANELRFMATDAWRVAADGLSATTTSSEDHEIHLRVPIAACPMLLTIHMPDSDGFLDALEVQVTDSSRLGPWHDIIPGSLIGNVPGSEGEFEIHLSRDRCAVIKTPEMVRLERAARRVHYPLSFVPRVTDGMLSLKVTLFVAPQRAKRVQIMGVELLEDMHPQRRVGRSGRSALRARESNTSS